MEALVSFFVIVIVSFFSLRVGTIILCLTGISDDIARFQAISVFSGTGFSTRESEIIVNHPVRRKVLTMLMWTRSFGFVIITSSLIIYFVDINTPWDFLLRGAYLSGGVVVLFLLSRIKLLDNFLTFLVQLVVKRWTKIPMHDYDSLLNLSSEYEVSTCLVAEDSWVANKALIELQLPDEGILVLGIRRTDGYYVGIPQGNTIIFPEDRLIMYGREDQLRNIGNRKAGEAGNYEHTEEVKRQLMIKGKKALTKDQGKGFLKKLFERFKK